MKKHIVNAKKYTKVPSNKICKRQVCRTPVYYSSEDSESTENDQSSEISEYSASDRSSESESESVSEDSYSE